MRNYRFGDFMFRCRKRKGLSQFQLGKLLGVSDKAVSKWETGVAKPRSELFSEICRILEISVEELLENLE